MYIPSLKSHREECHYYTLILISGIVSNCTLTERGTCSANQICVLLTLNTCEARVKVLDLCVLVCVCACVCMHVCMHACVCVCVCVCVFKS